MAYELIQGVDIPKDPYSGTVPVLSVEHVEVHAGRSYVVSGTLSVLNADVGSVQITVPDAAAATVTVVMTNDNADMTYTANTVGARGNDVAVVHVDPSGEDAELAVSLDCVTKVLTISLATGSDGAITSTAAEVAAAVNADPVISRVLTASADGTGAGIVEEEASANLAGGADKLAVHFKAASVSVTDGPMTAIFKEDASFVATGTAFVPVNRNRLSSGKSQLTVKTNADTTVVDGAAKVDIFTVLLGAPTPGNTKVTGESNQGEEILLANGENYLLQVTNSAGTTETVTYFLEWYERVHDVFRWC